MKSPFPGMDPYLEFRWPDVHAAMNAYIRDALQPQLPPALRARIESDILLEAPADDASDPQTYSPDVHIVEVPDDRTDPPRPPSGVATLAAPYVVRHLSRPVRRRWVKVIDTSSGDRVVTAIELLSPSNKLPGRPNRDYLAKLDDLEAADVNVVEIDLIRSVGRARLHYDQREAPEHLRSPYVVGIRRSDRPSNWYVFPQYFRTPLTPIPIPLRRSDPEITLDLQPLLDRAYTAGGHDDIDYTQPLTPPLPPEDTDWLAQRLKDRH